MDGLQPLYSDHTAPDTIPFPAPLRLLKRQTDTIDAPVEGLPVTEAEIRKAWYDAPELHTNGAKEFYMTIKRHAVTPQTTWL